MFNAKESTFHNGFQMKFKNGYTISVQFGKGNYCHHEEGVAVSAEIAIWDADGKWFNFEHDQVKGYCSPNEVAEWISKASNF